MGKPLKWFLGFPQVCSKLGIKQIALGGGEITLFPSFIADMVKECSKHGVKLNITTNGRNLDYPLEGVTLVSTSIDSYKQPDTTTLHEVLKRVEKIGEGNLTGINLLLDNKLVKTLPFYVSQFLNVADFVYVLQMKPSNLKTDLEALRTTLLTLSTLYPRRFFVDDSLKLSLGLQERCGRGVEIISVRPDGGVSACSFDEPFAWLGAPSDLIDAIKTYYPKEATTRCPFLKRKHSGCLPFKGESTEGRGMPC